MLAVGMGAGAGHGHGDNTGANACPWHGANAELEEIGVQGEGIEVEPEDANVERETVDRARSGSS